MKILAVETSCDETAVCLIEADGTFGPDFHFKVLGNALLSQVAVHAPYGGVFPNLAKREHSRNLVPLLKQVLQDSGNHEYQETNPPPERFSSERAGKQVSNDKIQSIKTILEREPELLEQLEKFLSEHDRPHIDAVAVTYGPGLEPALWVGVNFAKALSLAWDIPIVPVNHLEGHIAMALTQGVRDQVSGVSESQSVTCNLKPVTFPAIALLISGGHTELDLVSEWPKFKTIGETRDDAVGEAFDKVARMMGLPYPGGPEISRLAAQARAKFGGVTSNLEVTPPNSSKLPRPMLHEDNFDFSFSGLKTAVLRLVKDKELSDEEKMQIAREFEEAAADVLVHKTMRAVAEYGAQTVVIGGGVSANEHIRAELNRQLSTVGCKLLCPPAELATDNALMIALAGYFHALNKEFTNPKTLRANGNLRLGNP